MLLRNFPLTLPILLVTTQIAPAKDVLNQQQWDRLDQSSARALAWLAGQQRQDGSFPSIQRGQPGVTSFCVLAFAANGHLPGEGRYGGQLQRAVEFVLRSQKSNGLLSYSGPSGRIDPRRVHVSIGVPASYNHALSSLMLSEIYGMGFRNNGDEFQGAIQLALDLSLEMQGWKKARNLDRGGWRYLTNYDQYNADLSVSGWYLMSLRSAKNAGFDITTEPIDQAVGFIERCYLKDQQKFTYFPASDHPTHPTHAMQGAGILALSHAGVNTSKQAKGASEWLLAHPFTGYRKIKDAPQGSRYHYGLFLCTLAMHQMGDRYWEQFFPGALNTLLEGQQPDGSWPAEQAKNDHHYGNCYTTALSVLTMATPNELLPIFQR